MSAKNVKTQWNSGLFSLGLKTSIIFEIISNSGNKILARLLLVLQNLPHVNELFYVSCVKESKLLPRMKQCET